MKTTKRDVIVYARDDCGARGVKLWRDYSTFLNHQELRCKACALKSQAKHIDEQLRGDQIGYLVPAVPTYERDTFWGYTSVPPEDVAWWKALPETP